MHLFCWDLDKTYLETELGSVRGMVRAALEPAARKRDVPGAAALLRALQTHDPTSLTTVVSGSPPQLRAVLEQKLAADRVRVDRWVLKDSLGHLRRGRLRAVWSQIGHKLPSLLELRAQASPNDRETLFGDDTEVDGLIYTVYADAISGRIDAAQLRAVMERGGAYPDEIDRATSALSRCGRADAVEDVFIRLEAGGPLVGLRALGPRVTPVFSWFQAALVLWRRGRISPDHVAQVANDVMTRDEADATAIAGLTQDAARRGLAPADRLAALFGASPALAPLCAPVATALSRLGTLNVTGYTPSVADPLRFLQDRG